jgi:cell wall-associated NlpC family hydrolase
MPINGVALGALAVGSVFLYSAVKGKSILATAQSVITGKNPGSLPNANPITPVIAPSTSGSLTTSIGNVTGIAAIADSYIGKLRYVYGGPPPIGTVDCSSFTSKVLAQAGVKDPGGSPYDPNTHGPTTLSYLTWNGAKTVGHTADVSIPGDLIVWQTHMGIAVGNGQYVSAHDPAEGVSAAPISFPGEMLFVRRLNT